ncbi:cytochrome b [Martelella endophytica]|uniref:Cytochrome B561 n=1 Tax=Martelella endophytica TaxID=1486262 RepID=A0A0D5LQQ2_MAREN|nr:cytochrome b/b6 domain-containing protein [Martelella endophytica]AJY46092.1 cytochrome B561 [Martelella endophytica]
MHQTPVSFSVPQRILHWAVALLVFFNLLFPDGMGRWAHLFFSGEPVPADVVASANIHAYVGIAVLVLALIRLALRLIQGVPADPEDEPAIFRLLSKVAHWTFYLLFIAMPLAGMAGYYLGSGAAAEIHGGPMKVLMWALIVAHVGAVAVHQFYWKTGILKRMTTG